MNVGGAKRLAVKDYKFGKPHLHVNPRYADNYGDQQRIYVAGFTELTGEKPVSAELLYPRGPGIRRIDISEGAMKQTLLGFRAGWDIMNRSADEHAYEARPSALCSWCPAVNSCPVANKSTKANAVEARRRAPGALQLGIPTLRPNAAPADVPQAPPIQVPSFDEQQALRDIAGEAALSPVLPEVDATILTREVEIASDPGLIQSEAAERARNAGEPTRTVDLGFVRMEVATGGTPADALENDPSVAEALDVIDEQHRDQEIAEPGLRAEAIPPRGDDLFPITILDDTTSAANAVHEGIEAGTVPTSQPLSSHGESHSASGEETMSENQVTPQGEAVPYEETAGGSLNLNSYAAGATAGLVSLAFETLVKAGVPGNPTNAKALATTFAGIVLRAQKQLTGVANFQRGANTRLRGFLHTWIDNRPAPFGGTPEDWQKWISGAERWLVFGVGAAISIWDENPIENDAHLIFAGAPTAPTPYAG